VLLRSPIDSIVRLNHPIIILSFIFSATAWVTTRSGNVSWRETVLSCDRLCDLLCDLLCVKLELLLQFLS